MSLHHLADWLRGERLSDEPTSPPIGPKLGAAGLLVAAAHRDGRYTPIEVDAANAALMKLFHIGRPEADDLRQRAEAALFEGQRSFMTFAVGAKALDRDDQEALITHLWRLVASDGETMAENVLISSVRDVFGLSRAQAETLRPAVA